MGNTLEAMLQTLSQISGYSLYFEEAFGTDEINQLLVFMEALDGEGYQDTAPSSFPQ